MSNKRKKLYGIRVFWVCLVTVLCVIQLGAKDMEDKTTVTNMIKVHATDKEGKRELNINMPLEDALPVLKAAYLVGDSRFKYQIMSNGFMKYNGTLLEEEVISFLSDQFSKEITPIKGDIVFCLFIINPYSSKTAEVFQKATKIVGESKEEIFVRQLASDFLKYLETNDPSLLAKYNFLPNELPQKKLIGSASQQTTNQTAVGVQGSGKTNDLGTSGNTIKP